MKKTILSIIILLFTVSLFSQENTTSEDKSFEEILKPYIEKTLNSLEKGIEFAAEEIPIVLKQYIIFEAVSYWLYSILIPFIIFIICNKIDKFFIKHDPDSYPKGIIHTFNLIGVSLFIFNISSAIKATFFPKLFLIEQFIKLV